MSRVFISHASPDAAFAYDLRAALETQRLLGFVAPWDVRAGDEWFQILDAQLRHCIALVAVITPHFRHSSWCDQEVGFALGSGHAVVPLRLAEDDPLPHGFLGRFQALTVGSRDMDAVASDIFDAILLQKPLTVVALILDALAVERANVPVRQWSRRLSMVGEVLEPHHKARLAEIAAQSSTLSGDKRMYDQVQALLR